jgi:hypothetical protein
VGVVLLTCFSASRQRCNRKQHRRISAFNCCGSGNWDRLHVFLLTRLLLGVSEREGHIQT